MWSVAEFARWLGHSGVAAAGDWRRESSSQRNGNMEATAQDKPYTVLSQQRKNDVEKKTAGGAWGAAH
eukprot:568978-Pleurochrysis_carterae.AAC.3